MSYTTYELALNQDIQQRLYEEVIEASGGKKEIDYDTLTKLTYLDAVISETLRLYNPVVRIERTTAEDCELADTGIKLFKGQIVAIPIHAIHHCAEYYPEPYKFNPERFLPENRHLLTPYTYLPFSAGPRNCIGSRFALLEAKLALVKIMMQFKFVRTERTKVPLEYTIHRNLNQAKEIIVGVQKR